jgi:hypothetical protein
MAIKKVSKSRAKAFERGYESEGLTVFSSKSGPRIATMAKVTEEV